MPRRIDALELPRKTRRRWSRRWYRQDLAIARRTNPRLDPLTVLPDDEMPVGCPAIEPVDPKPEVFA